MADSRDMADEKNLQGGSISVESLEEQIRPTILSGAFVLPPEIESDETLKALHTEIVNALRSEASGMPMTSVQTLLLERIAYYYVVMRRAELRPDGDVPSVAETRAHTTFWLSMTQEFNKVLMSNQDKMRDALILEINDIIQSVLPLIEDTRQRATVKRVLAEKFAQINL